VDRGSRQAASRGVSAVGEASPSGLVFLATAALIPLEAAAAATTVRSRRRGLTHGRRSAQLPA
jgi:hypothetical protein